MKVLSKVLLVECITVCLGLAGFVQGQVYEVTKFATSYKLNHGTISEKFPTGKANNGFYC